jgi:tRNA A37 threonylcarbamoyladenosine synthetase subunit TsaC/SUA5/YrdC
VDVVVEGGRCRGLPSTVVSLLGREPALLREGALSAAQLSAALRRKVRGA